MEQQRAIETQTGMLLTTDFVNRRDEMYEWEGVCNRDSSRCSLNSEANRSTNSPRKQLASSHRIFAGYCKSTYKHVPIHFCIHTTCIVHDVARLIWDPVFLSTFIFPSRFKSVSAMALSAVLILVGAHTLMACKRTASQLPSYI